MINRLVCLFKGHRRGKRTGNSAAAAGFLEFRCPRCGSTWQRKEKKAA